MRNLEIKAAITDKEKTLAAVKSLGAVYQYTMRQRDYYFSVGENKKKLRIIDDKEYQVITYRRVEIQGRKDSQYLLEIISAQEADDLLKHNKPARIVDKTRELWLYQHTRIHIDHVEGLGEFLELETVVGDMPIEEAEKEINFVVSGLGINIADSVAASYSDLVPALVSPLG